MAVDFIQKSAGNSASTTLSSSVSNTDTAFPLTSDTAFLSGGGMVIIDEGLATEEIAYYTGKSGASLTVPLANRGLEGGSAQAHASGATVKGILSADMWNNFSEALVNVTSVTTGALDTTKVTDLTTAQTLTNKRLTSPKINENVALTSTATELNLLTGKTSFPVKATGAEVTTGTDDAKFATPKALADADVNTRLKSKVITLTRDLTTATGSVAYTGVGFVPTSIKAFGVVDGTAFVSEGFSDSTKTSQCVYQYGSNTWSMSAGLLAMSPTISAYQIATVASYDADGFTLTWTKTSTPTGTATVRVICYR